MKVMDQARPAPQPIGLTELVAGLMAALFAAVAGGWLLAALATGRPGALTQALAQSEPGAALGSCANAPATPLAMRLGRLRQYAPPVSITLDPVPFSVTPAVDGATAYKESGLELSGCNSEQLLALYTSAAPAYDHVLAWVFVSTTDCPSAFPRSSSDALGPAAVQRQCVSVSALNAGSGSPMGTRMFLEPR